MFNHLKSKLKQHKEKQLKDSLIKDIAKAIKQGKDLHPLTKQIQALFDKVREKQ
jgi:hypothetical protein